MLKVGAQYELRQRSYGIEAYSTLGSRNPQYFSLALQPLDSMFQAPELRSGEILVHLVDDIHRRV